MKIFLAKINLFKKPFEVKGQKELLKIITNPPKEWADFTVRFYKKQNNPIPFISNYSAKLTNQNNILIHWHSIEDEMSIHKSNLSEEYFLNIFKNPLITDCSSKLFFDGYSE